MAEPLLEIDDLTIRYDTNTGPLTAVSDASLTVDVGEYYGLVGESGCGKSTLAQSLIGGLDDNGRIESGTITYKGTEIQNYGEREFNRNIRWKEISYIPQSSMNVLDPLQRISEQAVGIADAHTDLTKAEALDRFEEMFEIVGLNSSRVSEYPHQFSGGMEQRAVIALALFLDPSMIIADEPTTALDVIMQDEIFNYLDRIQAEQDTSILLITHDISLVFESCQDMAVMHGGQIAESGNVTDLYDDPKHPYSILLQRAFPDIEDPDRELEVVEGHPPQLLGDVDYCTFVDRCPWAVEECNVRAPPLEQVAGDDGSGHQAACVRKDEHLTGQAAGGDDD